MDHWTKRCRGYTLFLLAVVGIGLVLTASILNRGSSRPLRVVDEPPAGQSKRDSETSSEIEMRQTLELLGPGLMERTYISVSGAAFQSFLDAPGATLFGSRFGTLGTQRLSMRQPDEGPGYSYAPVQLPHGATVTGVRVVVGFNEGYGDNRPLEEGTLRTTYTCKLMRTADPREVATRGRVAALEMAVCGKGAGHTNPTTTITEPLVDNSRYAYYLTYHTDALDATVRLYAVIINCAFLGGEETSEETSF